MRHPLRILTLSLLAISLSAWAQPIRGTWVTNVASNALRSEENIRGVVEQCRRHGVNTVFVVVWNAGKTMYPSDVAERHVGIRQDPLYGGFDPLKSIIEQGHAAGLRVHAWFEYGFAYGYRDSLTPWAKRYPHWAGRNAKGHLLQKNGFYWFNALHPEVQEMMRELVLEVVRNYDVDGVQGDDRLPAMPSEGGYDEWTLQAYRSEHGGADPPKESSDSAWRQWKADRLSAYGESLYKAVKKVRRDCRVTWSPSIYPWSLENYLQDWPRWLKGGYADAVLPQLYRYDIKAYEKILKELQSQVPKRKRRKVFPGMLTSLGNGYRVKEDMLREMIRLNRAYGFQGECLFYYETLPSMDKPIYPGTL
jgi:uncharacterized lipoprotein YddW (UPF0748 family)